MTKHYDKQFKEDALQYRRVHPDPTILDASCHPGTSAPTFYNWQKQARQNDNQVESGIILSELKTSTSGYYNGEKRKLSKQEKNVK